MQTLEKLKVSNNVVKMSISQICPSHKKANDKTMSNFDTVSSHKKNYCLIPAKWVPFNGNMILFHFRQHLINIVSNVYNLNERPDPT